MTTRRQRAAVEFCESMLKVKFEGDINNFKEVSKFLDEYLQAAKAKASELMGVMLDY